MDVSYFAETKGVVGCHYSHYLAFEVRDLSGSYIEFCVTIL
jgi:hypothetical protein